MKKIRVLHFTEVINRFDFIDVIIRFSNRERFVMQAATYTRISNIEPPEYDRQNIVHHSLEISWGYVGFLIGVFRLAKHIRKEQIDVLHTHHYYESVMGRAACWLYPKCRHVVGRHYHNDLYLTTKGLKLRFYLFVESIVNRFANAIVSPSSQIDDLLTKQGVAAQKIWFVPYGFDFTAPRYQPLTVEQKEELRGRLKMTGKFLIGNFSRHHRMKGQLDLLAGFKSFASKHDDARLLMIGDGPYRGELEKYVRDSGLHEQVVFLGWRKDGHLLMNAMEVIVHPTLQEAFPQTMIEVMALSIPLMICPVSGATDVIRHEKNGILIPFRSPEIIEQYLEKIYVNRSWALALGLEAKDTAYSYEVKNVINSYQAVYEAVINQNQM